MYTVFRTLGKKVWKLKGEEQTCILEAHSSNVSWNTENFRDFLQFSSPRTYHERLFTCPYLLTILRGYVI